MTERPLLSATLIAKNEKHQVRRCLDSIWPWVDEVCVADTGSTDGTLAEFKRYAQQRKQPGKLKTVRVTECNDRDGHIKDFAAARQAADDLATGRFVIWADLDDEIVGLDRLREMVAAAPDDIQAFFIRYAYARDQDGNTISELWRERVVRHDGTRWTGRLHEHKLITRGTVVRVPAETCEYLHHRDHTQRTGDRNLRILEAWNEEEPNNTRILHSLAMEYMGVERHRDASDTFARMLALGGEPPDRRAQACRHMCQMLLMQGRAQEARLAALQSLSELFLWADTHLTLAETAQTLGRPDEGLVHAQTAITIGQPDTVLIINPLQYTAHPRAIMAVCLGQLGRLEEAVSMCEQALQIAPSYPLAVQQLPTLRAALKKQHAVGAITSLADVLVEAGELEKAQTLLGCAPFYVADDRQVIGKRVQVTGLLTGRRQQPPAVSVDEAAEQFTRRHLAEAA